MDPFDREVIVDEPTCVPIDDQLSTGDLALKHGKNQLSKLNRAKLRWFARYRRVVLKLGAYLSRLNARHDRGSELGFGSRNPLWSDVLYCFYYYTTIKMFIVAYEQLIFDSHKYKLDRFRQLVRDHQRAANWTLAQVKYKEAFEAQLVAQYEQARDSCKSIGAPFLNFNYLAFNLFVCLIIVQFITYVFPQLYHVLGTPFNYSIMYTIIAPHRLQESLDLAICDAVNNFIASHTVYHRIREHHGPRRAVFMAPYMNKSPGRSPPTSSLYWTDQYDCSSESLLRTCPLRRPGETHWKDPQLLVKLAKSMALDGLFQPFNRRRDWLTHIANMYGLTLVGLISALVVACTIFLAIFPRLSRAWFETDPLDLLYLVEFSAMGLIVVAVAGFYITLTLMICIDQGHAVSELIRRLDYRVYENTFALQRWLESTVMTMYRLDSDASWDDLYRRSNASLMHVLVHYKLFVKQSKSPLETIRIAATINVLVMYLPVVITRLFIAYISHWQKTLSLLGCIGFAALASSMCSMMCRLHSRSLDIYGRMQSLMAHVIAVNYLVELKTGTRLYDDHLTWLLRRELSHPERLTERCATRMLGLQKRMTYATLMNFLFWWGLLATSVSIIDPTEPDQADVFGCVWRFYRRADAEISAFFDGLYLL